MYLELTSSLEVSVSGIGVLTPGEPHRVTDEESQLFEIYNGQPLIGAQFAPYVQLTAVVEEEVNNG